MRTALMILCVIIIGGMINMILGCILIGVLSKKKTSKINKALLQIRENMDIVFVENCHKQTCTNCPLSSSATGHNTCLYFELVNTFDNLDKTLKNQ